MKKIEKMFCLMSAVFVLLFCFSCSNPVDASVESSSDDAQMSQLDAGQLQSTRAASGEVTRSGSTWYAKVNGKQVYKGSRMFDAVNTACNKAGKNATIHIRNSGDSGNDNGNIYAIRPVAGQTLDFHGCTVNCNGKGDLDVAVYAKNRNGITIKNLKVTGSPRYGLWFLGCSDLTITNITMKLSRSTSVGLGIRVEGKSRTTKNLKINGTININGSKGHGIETYTIDGVTIGNVTVNNTGGCGVLLNNSKNCKIGVIKGSKNCPKGGYATFRVANTNSTTHCKAVYSKDSGRGFFSVSGSKNCTIDYVDIKNSYKQGIFLENATNTKIKNGKVSGGHPNIQHVKCSKVSTKVNGKTYTANNGKW